MTSHNSHVNNNAGRSHSSAHGLYNSVSTSANNATSSLPPLPILAVAPGSPTPTTLDMKRLLAKPAPPYARTHHSNGSGSDSEGISDSPRRKPVQVDRGTVRWRLRRSRSVPSLPHDQKEQEIDITTSDKEKEKRPRNVLRRRPSTQLQNKKTPPALPMTTPTNVLLHSPLPPIAPRSPLSPSILPSDSPVSITSFSPGSSSRPTTAPSSPRYRMTGVHPARSASSFDRPSGYIDDRPSGSGLVQPRRERSVEEDVEECVVNVTDERGKKSVDVKSRLRQLRGSPISLSSSPSPSRSHSPSSQLRHHPHHLSTASASNRRSSRSRSRSRNPQPIYSEVPSTTDSTTTGLTPAAAVAAAYKHQESLHKIEQRVGDNGEEQFAFMVHTTTRMEKAVKEKRRPHTSSGLQRSATELPPRTSTTKTDSAEDNKHQPYYTVLGTSSERVMAAGGPGDHHLSWDIVPPSTLIGRGGIRTLSRKVSGRFKRAGNGTQSEGEEREEKRRVSLSAERERGRSSFSGSRSAKRATLAAFGKGEKGGLSLRLSIDKFSEAKVLRGDRDKKDKDSTPTSATKSPSSGASTPSPSPSGGGSKIWKLMKKISTGGLREKFTYEEAPPVPELPKEYVAPAPIRPPFETQKDTLSTSPLTEGLGQAIRKKASVVLGITTNAGSPTKPSLPPCSPLSTQFSIPSVRPSLSAPRPSINTRSSSPVSSEVASLRFFSGYKPSSMSAHSSMSSLPMEDNTPPLPDSLLAKNSSVGQHIVPPSELGRIHIQADDERGETEELFASALRKNPTSPARNQIMKLKVVVPTIPSSLVKSPLKNDDYVSARTPTPETVSLTLPPRRPEMFLGRTRRDTNLTIAAEAEEQNRNLAMRNEGMKEWEHMWASPDLGKDQDNETLLHSRSGSPMIPSFSTVDTIDTFSSKRVSTNVRSPTTTVHSPPLIQRHPSPLDNRDHSPTQLLSPPPRPARNPQRLARSTPTSPVKSLLSPSFPPSSPSNSVPRFINIVSPSRRSTDGNSVASSLTIKSAHLRRRSSSFLSTSLGSPPLPPTLESLESTVFSPRQDVTFRELGQLIPGHALTEQEKMARWDDLLERSTRAGGTLHLNLGEEGLKSDRLRFSDISEMSSM